MNSNSSKHQSSWKRYKTQYFAIASGVVLAASAGLAFIPSQSHDSAAPAAVEAGPVASTLQLSQAAQPRPVVYFVDSEAARDALRAQGKEFIVYSTIDTNEASEATRELLAINSEVLVVNLMGQPVPAQANEAASRETQEQIAANITAGEQMMRDALAPNTPAQQAVASESAIMGGVLSSEYATWGAPAPASESQPAALATEADIMGGVLSTERATWGAPTDEASAANRPVQPQLVDTYVYLVSTEEKQAQMSSQFADEDAIQLAFGLLPTKRLVVVAPAGSSIEAELASASSPVADAPSVHVIDAR